MPAPILNNTCDGRGGAEVAGPPRRVQRLLAPSDGPRYRQIVLTLGAAGDIGLALHEMGGSPTAPWGFDDLEITAAKNTDGSIAVVVMNRSEQPITFTLKNGNLAAPITIARRAIMTIVI